ncbi:MAG: glutamate-1-semialdehyde 2,1-aminomutase [Elusimicrobiota bacterium]|nr:glutamate-1-semialdehyde 2,1-aminomutase [Elusimicrobiota bacterium]
MDKINYNILYSKANKYLVGGVNSPVRAFIQVAENPLFVNKAYGSKIYSTDKDEYIDYIMSWGALILGHSYPKVISFVKKIVSAGTSFGLTTPFEVKLAEMICKAIPSIEKIRFTNSGTEAVMSALRLARAFTKRKKIIKFRGCYHGHYDCLLLDAGSGIATFNIATSEGILNEFIKDTIVLEYNDVETFEKVVKQKWREIACVILEPVAANMGVILPEDKFLEKVVEFTKLYGIVLIFDEVITGFRLCYGGYQNLLGIKPDLTILGKIIGGGFPVGAYGGKREIMNLVSPLGGVYQAGTLSGNPVSITAGISVLKILKKNKYIYKLLKDKTQILVNEIIKLKKDVVVSSIGSMFTIFFRKGSVKNYNDAKKSDIKKFALFHKILRDNFILFPPSQFESCFLSYSHSRKDIDTTIKVIFKAFNKI